ncbi:MAG: putative metal-binding motif-containing protein [Myxococcales bacterium]|nr:putative metal-binding motif-containing protein [Myxococcales bacterium]
MRIRTLASFVLAAVPLYGCGGDDAATPDAGLPPLFEPKPECQGQSIAQFTGMHTQVISKLAIGSQSDGFDLDGDGRPDNKLQGVGALANPAIGDSLNDYSLLIPMEMFDFPTAAVDSCVKFALYLGDYRADADTDGDDTAVANGDCNDHAMAIHPGAVEVPGNFIDDDCDGLADEQDDGPSQTPSADTMDRDGDGASPATGDCDDTNPLVGGLVASVRQVEICGDGYDNDCSGVADRGAGDPPDTCYPFDNTPDTISIDPLSFENGAPIIKFDSGEVKMTGGKLELTAGPSLFAVSVPITSDIVLTLKITGTQIKADVVEQGGFIMLKNGHLGGVIDARTADTIRGLTVDQIGLKPEDSLLDAIFANVLGTLLALPTQPNGSAHPGCKTPDIDVDRDGLEIFCDTDSDNDPDTKVVDLCIDGDGTEIRDEVVGGVVVKHCTEALLPNGKSRFPDGISVELNFETAPATLAAP